MDDVSDLVRGLRELERRAPAELDAAVYRVADEVVVPHSRVLTPRKSGALAGATRAVRTPVGAAVVNKQVYANVQHWGGRTRRPKVGPAHGDPIAGKRFVSRVMESDPAVDEAVMREFVRLAEKYL